MKKYIPISSTLIALFFIQFCLAQEYKFIKPLGYSLMTILAFQMLNNGVHWASDYPLALAMGYSLGMLATSQGRIEVNPNQRTKGNPVELGLKIGIVGPSAVGISTVLIYLFLIFGLFYYLN